MAHESNPEPLGAILMPNFTKYTAPFWAGLVWRIIQFPKMDYYSNFDNQENAYPNTCSFSTKVTYITVVDSPCRLLHTT